MVAMAATQGVRSFVARRGGGGGCGGARKHVREARGGRWPWQRRAMATAALTCARGRENQGRGKEWESERAVGAAWHRPGRSRRRGGSRRWPGKQEVEARRCARVGTRRSPVGEEDDRGGGPGGLGRLLAGPACCGWAAQGKGGPGKSLLPFISVFYFFLTFV